MNQSVNLDEFNPQDVISFDDFLLKVEKLDRALSDACVNVVPATLQDTFTRANIRIPTTSSPQPFQAMFQDGLACEVLRLGSSAWQTGKIRLRIAIEFIPDQIETDREELDPEALANSPLDPIRHAINGSV